MTGPLAIDPSVLSLMRCPVTKSELTEASNDLIEKANILIASSQLSDRLGQPVAEPFESALINTDRSLLIPIRGGIIVMLEDRLIPMTQFE